MAKGKKAVRLGAPVTSLIATIGFFCGYVLPALAAEQPLPVLPPLQDTSDESRGLSASAGSSRMQRLLRPLNFSDTSKKMVNSVAPASLMLGATAPMLQEAWIKKALSSRYTLDEKMCTTTLDRQTMGLLPELMHFLQSAPPPTTPASSSDDLFTVSDAPPPGFEALNDPQTTVLNVYYAGEALGTIEATFTPTWVQVTNPAQLVDRLKQVKDKPKIIAALSGQLMPHADLVCSNKRPMPVCSLPPLQNAAVVFDMNTYRLDVFVAPEYLTAAAPGSDFLPSPTADKSFSDNLSLVAAGSTPGGPPNYNFVQQGALADGSKRINYQASYAQSNSSGNGSGQWQIQQLNGEWDYKQYATRVGYIETVGDTFIGNQNILGASVGTSLNTLRQDKRNIYGSSLVVFLSLPSQVSIYKDNRLVGSGFYQAGQQTIDTTPLPVGSYPITLKIQDSLGGMREETHFYVKSTVIPPKDHPLYYANLGYLTGISGGSTNSATLLPQPSSTLIYQLGLNKRIGENWGFNANSVGSVNTAYLSSGFFFLLPYYQLQLQPQVVVGSGRDYGVALTSSAAMGRLNLNLSARKLWAQDDTQTATTSATPSALVTTATGTVFDPLTQNQSQLSLGAGYSFGDTSLNFTSQWNKAASQPSSYSYGLNSRTIVHRFGRKGYIELDLSGSRSSTDPLLLVASVIWHINGDKLNSTVSTGYQRDQGNPANNGLSASAGTTWNNYDAAQRGISIGAGISQIPGQQTVNTNFEDLNRYLYATGQAQYSRPTGDDSSGGSSQAITQYSGNISSRLVWAQGEHPVFAGARSQSAGAVVDIDSDLPGEDFQVLNNQQVVGIVKTNASTPIFLNSYQSYQLSIKPVSQGFFTYDERPREIILYPGNYQYMTWKARQKLIIFTKVLLPNHQPLPLARVEGSADFNYTDEQGYIQLEIFQDTRDLEFQQSADQRCQVKLPQNIEIKNSFAAIDSVVCVPVPGSKPMNQPAVPKDAIVPKNPTPVVQPKPIAADNKPPSKRLQSPFGLKEEMDKKYPFDMPFTYP